MIELRPAGERVQAGRLRGCPGLPRCGHGVRREQHGDKPCGYCCGNDPAHRAQSPRELLGKMLRIDVNVADSHPSGYEVPADNPFVSSGPAGTRPEIWAFGLRNPWRYTFDDVALGGTGALIIGDVGQSGFEEIDYEPRGRGGRNYGWRNREGAHDNLASPPPAYLPLVDPIHEYDRNSGESITGGFIYRGSALGTAL